MKLLLADRDGTIIERSARHRYLYGLHEFRLRDCVAETFRNLQRSGVTVAVCTNQQGVALDEFPEMTLDSVMLFHRRLNDVLGQFGVKPLRYYICPHRDSDGCNCRKPKAGLLLDAMVDARTNRSDVWFIGDQLSDVEAAINAGVQPFLLTANLAECPHGAVPVQSWDAFRRRAGA